MDGQGPRRQCSRGHGDCSLQGLGIDVHQNLGRPSRASTWWGACGLKGRRLLAPGPGPLPTPRHSMASVWEDPGQGVPAPPPPREALGPQLRDLPASSETSQRLWTLRIRPWGAGVIAPHGKVAPPLSARELAGAWGRRDLTQCRGFLQVRPASWAEERKNLP